MRFTLPQGREGHRRRSAGSGRGPGGRGCRAQQAFSFVELLIASSLLLIVALALVGSNMSGLRLTSIVQQQTSARQLERWVTETISRDIREAAKVEVGLADFASFLVPTNGAPYVGNGLRLTYVQSGATNTRVYFLEGTQLKQRVDLDFTGSVVVSDVTNPQPFMAVDAVRCATNALRNLLAADALTNDVSRPLIRVWLRLSTVGGQSRTVGPGTSFNTGEILFTAGPRGS